MLSKRQNLQSSIKSQYQNSISLSNFKLSQEKGATSQSSKKPNNTRFISSSVPKKILENSLKIEKGK